MLKLKNNKKNMFYMLIGRLATFVLCYAGTLWVSYKIIEYILLNCITTIK